jgi:hypothetical protein
LWVTRSTNNATRQWVLVVVVVVVVVIIIIIIIKEAYTVFWWANLRERDHLRDPGVNGRIVLRWIFRKWDEGVWTGSSWLRIGTGGGNL